MKPLLDLLTRGSTKAQAGAWRLALSVLAVLTGLVSTGTLANADVPAARIEEPARGLAVVGLGSSLDAAWPLARAVYAEPSLRPDTLDEPHARVLVGEAPGSSGTAELRDLADTRAAIHSGDDAASRRLLSSIASALRVKGLVVVEGATPTGRASARVFITTLGTFEAVRYEADPGAPVTWGAGQGVVTWTGSLPALRRGFGEAPPPAPPPTAAPLATRAATTPPGDTGKGKAFYQSPWFWAAAGAAVFAAGAVYFATRNDGSQNVQLQVQVPR